ncbi:MAG TPA: hypothetical protein VE863_12470 [Pyrinomonadaceae bacterium]|jgi:hypothetical protein|nr:hypothetical protein [Pyrinomonadaceae bacterium]
MIDELQPKYSDETIRRFLLGRLDSTDHSLFERGLFTDDELEERVRLAELELADEYAADPLAAADREIFRDRFLVTKDRARLLSVSKALHENLTPAPVVRDIAGFRIGEFFNLRRHVWKYAFAMLVLLLLLTTALLIKKERSLIVRRHESPSPRSSPPPATDQTPRMMSHPNNSAQHTHNEISPRLPLHEGLTTSVVLVSATPLDSSPVISISGEVLTVELTLDQPLAVFYDVNVMTISGESVFSAGALKRNDSETLAFDVPAQALASGDFQISLTRVDGESKESAGVYYLRIR